MLYAAQRAGLRLTPINWHLTGEEAAYIVENCEAKAFVERRNWATRSPTGDGRGGGAPPGRVGAGLIRLAVGGDRPGFESHMKR